MDIETSAPDAPAPTVREAPSGTSDSLSAHEAGRILASVRRKPAAPAATEENSAPVESAEPATAEATESAVEADATPSEPAATGETQEETPAETPPSRPLPRSWTKDQTDYWAKLDPATQDFLVEQDRKASDAVRRSQNEAAEKAKALSAKEVAADQARNEFENRAKSALNVLLREQTRDFPDVKTMDDVRKLSVEDPLRYLQWQAHQQDLQVQAAAVREAEQRSTQAKQTTRQKYFDEQSARLKELVPDFADADKFSAAQKRAIPLLGEEYGFSLDQLNKWAATDAGFEILQSAGFQKLVADMLASRDKDAERTAADTKRAAEDAKRKAELSKKLVQTPVPPVQRP